MGAEMAEGEIFCYLNDDVSVGAGSIENLCAMFDDPSVGEVGPAGSYWKDCKHDSFADTSTQAEVDVISGFCFLVRALIFRKLGGFDVEFSPAGYEEIDFSYRIRQAGMKCMVVPQVEIKHFHHHGVSAQKMDITYLGKVIDTGALHERNTAYFKKKWQGGILSVKERT
jgi:GT2 family glycosyltransferase